MKLPMSMGNFRSYKVVTTDNLDKVDHLRNRDLRQTDKVDHLQQLTSLTTYVTVPGLALVTVPLFSFYQSFEQLLQSLVLLQSCVPACMLMIVID